MSEILRTAPLLLTHPVKSRAAALCLVTADLGLAKPEWRRMYHTRRRVQLSFRGLLFALLLLVPYNFRHISTAQSLSPQALERAVRGA
jgi:hypothetical protein